MSAGTIVLHALTYVPDALMQRRFDFRERLIVRPVVALTFAGTSIILCINGFGGCGGAGHRNLLLDGGVAGHRVDAGRLAPRCGRR